MTPVIWLFCLAVLRIKAVDTIEDEVPPLIMAVYGEGESKRITLTDSTAVVVDDLRWPLDKMEPTYIALLCPSDGEYSRQYELTVKQVTDRIGSINKKLKCSSYLRLHMEYAREGGVLFSDIGLTDEYKFVPYLRIRLNKQEKPTSITHRVIAHMHSNESGAKCENEEEIQRKFIFRVHSGFQMRHLVPIEDFNGIYTTKAICIVENYVELNNEASTSLESIEIFIRKVADVINEVGVVSGTYKNEKDDKAIPIVVWKKLSYKSDDKNYAVLVVIHNRKTERFCDKEDGWGWPEHNSEEKVGSHKENSEEKDEIYEQHSEGKLIIGTMYYCLMNSEISQKLDIEYTPNSPFNLHEIQHKGKTINVLEGIEANTSSSKIEQETPKQA